MGRGAQMASAAKLLTEEIASWPGVTSAHHQFSATEFRLGKAEIGHVHAWGDIDIPFTRELRDELIAAGSAARHRWLPNSGWITFHMRGEQDLEHAVWLMRLSLLRYTLKHSPDPEYALDRAAARMHLNPKLIALLSRFLPTAKPTAPTSAAIGAQVN
jgi:hypothetical protein